LELYEKIYVAPSFLETSHGEIDCQECHGGNPEDADWQTAHEGLTKDPTILSAERVCGDCHQEIVSVATRSLHYSLNPMYNAILMRAGGNCCSADTKAVLEKAMDRHCGTCHSSCGQCHVSRPDYVKGGFLSKHHFKKKPPMDTTCASCHGGRVHGEFTGANEDFSPDTHYEDEEMKCFDCHTMDEMHADATGIKNRRALPQKPSCLKCHEDILDETSKNLFHASHGKKLACHVCHSQASKSCFSCHVGTDNKGLPYYKCKKTDVVFKIGRNPEKTALFPYEYTVVRHAPVVPDTFKFYLPKGLEKFSDVPTWKPATPHNIILKAEQSKSCNSCHGNPGLFLRGKDLSEEEKAANLKVIVPADRIPKKILEQ
jgi:hypothetical protein